MDAPENFLQAPQSVSKRCTAEAKSCAVSAIKQSVPLRRLRPSAAMVVATTGRRCMTASSTLPLTPAPNRSGATRSLTRLCILSSSGAVVYPWNLYQEALVPCRTGSSLVYSLAPTMLSMTSVPHDWSRGTTDENHQRSASTLGSWFMFPTNRTSARRSQSSASGVSYGTWTLETMCRLASGTSFLMMSCSAVLTTMVAALRRTNDSSSSIICLMAWAPASSFRARIASSVE
mmetsp:Transcript_40222/g.95568  ORF Transcript_40222/g.95568 Transcript_40222/m.95568 type:complete len:232 (-) Transcript_40222:149-844(-)